jgi:hypothetical protein
MTVVKKQLHLFTGILMKASFGYSGLNSANHSGDFGPLKLISDFHPPVTKGLPTVIPQG